MSDGWHVQREIRIEDMSRRDLEALDQKMGYRRITGYEMEGLILLMTAAQLLGSGEKMLRTLCKAQGVRQYRAALGLLESIVARLTEGISLAQKKTLNANTRSMFISLNAAKSEGYTNIDSRSLLLMANTVMQDHCDMACDGSAKTARHCALCKALHQVIGLRQTPKDIRKDQCPFYLNGGEVIAEE